MRARLLTPLLAAALLSLTACEFQDFVDGTKYSHDFHYNFPLKADGRFEVETFNGSVEISGWDRDAVDISGTKYGPTQEAADSIRVDTEHSNDSVLVRAVRSSGLRNQSARFVIMVPKTAMLDRITTSNGPIRVKDTTGPIHLSTSNGALRMEDVGGPINASTSNGSVDISLTPDSSGDLRASTSNGSITLRSANEPNARLSARTSNGSVHSDFDVRVQGEISRNRLEGMLGGGRNLIELHTSNGSIRLVRR